MAAIAQAQLSLEDISSESGFDIRERDKILAPAGRQYRLTHADRTRLVKQAAAIAGEGASSAAINVVLRMKVSEMLRPFTNSEIMETATAISPCRTFAVLPITERAFYSFINQQFSPKVRGVFLWEDFVKRLPEFRYVCVHRETYLITRPWWSSACHNLVFRSPGQLRRGSHWTSFGLIDSDVAPLVQMFPVRADGGHVLVPDGMFASPGR